MFYTRHALLKTIPCFSHKNTYLKHSHVYTWEFLLLSQDLHDPWRVCSSYTYTHECRLEGQEMTHVGIALVNLLIMKIYGPVIRKVLPKESVHCMEL